jgi:hypothetical protein
LIKLKIDRTILITFENILLLSHLALNLLIQSYISIFSFVAGDTFLQDLASRIFLKKFFRRKFISATFDKEENENCEMKEN